MGATSRRAQGLDDALEIAAASSSRSRPPSARSTRGARGPADVRRSSARGPTGVELAGALGEICARHTARKDFRHIDPPQARVVLVEGTARVLAAYRRDAVGRGRAISSRKLRRRGPHRHRGDGHRRRRRERRRRADRRAHGALGGRRRGLAARRDAGRAARPRGPRRRRARPDASPGIPRSSSSATWPLVQRTRRAAARRRARSRSRWAITPPHNIAPQHRAASRASRSTIRQGDHGDDRPRGRPSRRLGRIGLTRLDRLGLAWLFIHIFFLIGFRNRLVVFLDWISVLMSCRSTARAAKSPGATSRRPGWRLDRAPVLRQRHQRESVPVEVVVEIEDLGKAGAGPRALAPGAVASSWLLEQVANAAPDRRCCGPRRRRSGPAGPRRSGWASRRPRPAWLGSS